MGLWYFDSARTCILPNEGYNAGAKSEQKVDGQDPTAKPINSATPGAAITLSFHVEAQNEIRCYLCVNGGMMRMMPEDLKNVVPNFFDETFGDNAKWSTSTEATELVKR